MPRNGNDHLSGPRTARRGSRKTEYIRMTMRILFLSLFLPLLASCVKQGDLDALNARMDQNEQQMQLLSSQVGNVEQVLPGQAEMWAQMQAMRQELNMVRGQLDEINAGGGAGQSARLTATVNRLEAAVRQMASELGLQIEALNAPTDTYGESAQPPFDDQTTAHGFPGAPSGDTVTQTAAGKEAPSQQTPPSGQVVDTAANLYESGMNAFASRNYRDAVKAFTDFTKHFPQHKLTSNAHFWRGESYYQLKDYAGAVGAYQEVIQNFSGSAKLQSSMLKQGMSLHYAGKKDAAKVRLNDLIKKYPSSPEAGRAKTFLQQNK